jgi:hypothetical protein
MFETPARLNFNCNWLSVQYCLRKMYPTAINLSNTWNKIIIFDIIQSIRGYYLRQHIVLHWQKILLTKYCLVIEYFFKYWFILKLSIVQTWRRLIFKQSNYCILFSKSNTARIVSLPTKLLWHPLLLYSMF